ncbi:hypothetical protein DAPPUDRAFT_330344 [Daphnia pulex]|uniref:Uncharacterized protein n=1 Tax=Daphnia pulex TaxID=6669 RepID=E9HJA6_DAPPU|nr:hypothetical protein DAPPUDRAFT_330344 [Daphnia pulex]|eukprot:EFX68138.1 hypothetical protein DAPPUDRAFT_330344 [Daphnia pulex]
MSELNPKSKRMKMDEYNEKRRKSRKKEIPFSGTRGFDACSSSALASNSDPELEKGRGKKRKRPLKSSSLGTIESQDDTSRKGYVNDHVNSCSSFQEYMEHVNQTSALHNLIENGVIDVKNDTRMPKKSWKERVEATECSWKEAFQTLLEDVFETLLSLSFLAL